MLSFLLFLAFLAPLPTAFAPGEMTVGGEIGERLDSRARDVCATDYPTLSAAVRACSENGGGRVNVPAGVFQTCGPIVLRSNVELHLSEGSTLVFPDRPEAYLPEVPMSHEGVEGPGLSPLIYAYGCTNVAITGSGVLLAQMEGWRKRMGTALMRPPFLHFNRCRDIRLENISIRNSPFWVVHLFRSENVTVRGVDIEAFDANNDAVDIEMSKNVLMEDCRLFAGDDGVAVKSGKKTGRNGDFAPTECVTVRRCRIVSGHALLSCGSELSGGIRNVVVEDCTGGAVDNVLRIKTNRTRGGFVENVVMRRVVADYAKTVFSISDQYANGVESDGIELDETHIENVVLSDVRVRRARIGIMSSWRGSRLPKGVVAKRVAIDEVTQSPLVRLGRDCVLTEDLRIPSKRIPASGIVFEKMDELDSYAAGVAGFEHVAAFLRREDLKMLSPGRYPLDGERVVAEIVETGLFPVNEPRYEFCPEDVILVLYVPEGGEYVRFGDEGAFFNMWPDGFTVIHPGMRFASGLTNREPVVRRRIRIAILNGEKSGGREFPARHLGETHK